MQAKEIKPGAVLNYNGAPVLIETVSVQTPSARGAATLRDMDDGDQEEVQLSELTERLSKYL